MQELQDAGYECLTLALKDVSTLYSAHSNVSFSDTLFLEDAAAALVRI